MNSNNVAGHLETFTDSFGRTVLLKHRFHPEAFLRYRAKDLESVFADDFKVLKDFIEHHRKRQRPRLAELYDYGKARNHTIAQDEYRRKETEMSDARAVHNFGGIMTTFKKGYMLGVPIKVEYAGQSSFEAVEHDSDFDDLNRQLVSDLSKVGRAYDIVYRRDDDTTQVRKLSPLETFVIYDYSLSQHSLCAVRYYSVNLFDKTQEFVEVYTNSQILTFEYDGKKLTETVTDIEQRAKHAFQAVPVTEYLNDEEGMGDYEPALSLIDLYDASQSDTANYMADLADAILGIFGDIAFPDDWTAQQQLDFMKTMRKARLMMLKPPKDADGKQSGTVDAKYLYKQYDVNGTEAYKTRIERDIHKVTGMPDLSDSAFAGTQSGVAMLYKLFGFDQRRVDTQTLFEKSLRRRYELVARIGKIVNEFGDFNQADLRVTFTPNLPKAMSEVIQNFKALNGSISNETAMRVTGIVDDPKQELENIQQETVVGSQLHQVMAERERALEDKDLTDEQETVETGE